VTEAVELALLEHRPLHIVHACNPLQWLRFPDPSGFSVKALKQTAIDDGEAMLRAAATQAAGRMDTAAVSTELIVDDPREALLYAAERASTLVIGSRGRGRVRSMTLGSVGVWVCERVQCPVVVVRRPRPGVEHVGVAVGADGTDSSAAALEFAYRQASLRRLPLNVVYCLPPPIQGGYGISRGLEAALDDVDHHRKAVADSLAGFAERYPDVEAHVHVTQDHADGFLSHLWPPPVLLVIGSRHRSTASAFFGGSVSRSVVEHASYPVAVVSASAAEPSPTGSADPAHATG
jgi:nucleotide-binding universal stress UspA family protein